MCDIGETVTLTSKSKWKNVTMVADFRKTGVFKKAQPIGFLGFYLALGFIGFSDFLFEQAVGKLVG